MFKRIMATLDRSQLAECILPHLVTLAAVYKAEVILIHVLESPTGTNGDPVNPLEWEMAKAEADAYLDRISEQLVEAGVERVTAVKLEGQPAQCIVEYIRTNEIDLVVLSSHGQSGLSRWNVSSVVRKVIQRANCSIMIVRAYRPKELESKAKAHYNRLLVPLDGSMRAECTLATAITIANYHEAHLLLSHIVEKPTLPSRMLLRDDDQALIEKFVERGKEMGREYLKNLETQLSEDIETIIDVSDDIAATLHELVKAQEVDLVLLCAHGRSGKTTWPFGSVTSRFIDYGTTPLLMIQDLNPDEVEPTAAELSAEESKGH
jgi:nucleotide-binding universal stress UspA family protein